MIAHIRVDYTGAAASGLLTFGAGARTAQINITPTNDTTEESAESVQLFVFDAGGALLVSETLNFYDDDCCKPVVFVSHAVHAREGGASGGITIQVIGPSADEVDPSGYTVWYQVVGSAVVGTDYETGVTLDANGRGSFGFSAGPATFTFDINAVDDALLAGTRSVSLTLLPGSPTLSPGEMLVPTYSLALPTSGTAQLFDNDARVNLVVGGFDDPLEDSPGVFLGLDDQFDPRAHELLPGEHSAVIGGSLVISTGGDSPTSGALGWSVPSGVNVYWFRKGHWLAVSAEAAHQIGPGEALLLQAIATGSSPFEATFTPAYGTQVSDSALLNVVNIDADVDSDNENGLERSEAEDAIEEDEPGVYVTIDSESGEFTLLQVEIGGIPSAGFSGADQELIMEFDADKLELWLDEAPVYSGVPIAIPSTSNYLFEFQVKGLPGLATQPIASTPIHATVRIFSGTTLLFQKADEVKAAVEPKIVKVEFIPFDDIDRSVGFLTSLNEQEKYGDLGARDSNPNGNPTYNGDVRGDPALLTEFTVNRALKQPAFLGGRRFFPDASIFYAAHKAEGVRSLQCARITGFCEWLSGVWAGS